MLDWGDQGLLETIRCLQAASVAFAGAGRNRDEASAPAVLSLGPGRRLLLFAYGSVTSGIPRAWSAQPNKPGVNVLEDLSESTASRLATYVRRLKQPGDLALASIHWGNNWGYDIPNQQIAFAHRLIDDGFDLVHGHSSHHIKSIEVYRDHLILYGCGDLITDYEGIAGYEEYRGSLALLYFAYLSPSTGQLLAARLVPMEMRRFQLQRPTATDSTWIRDLLNRIGHRFGTKVELTRNHCLNLSWLSSTKPR